MSASRPDTEQGIAGGLVRVAIGSTALLLPEGDVSSVESVLDVQPDAAVEAVAVGHVVLSGARCPVYALAPGLRVERVAPAERRVCIAVPGPSGPVGFLADAVTRVAENEIRRAPLPACMRMGTLPFQGLAVHGEEIQLTMLPGALGAWIARQASAALEAVA